MTDQPEPEDTCRPVEIDGETIRVRGSGEMSEESQAALAEVIRAAKRKMAAEPPPIRQQIRAVAFNAVAPALKRHDEWLRLTVRRSIADAVLAAIEDLLDLGEAEAWCKICHRVWDSKQHRCESDAEQRLARAEAALARVTAAVDNLCRESHPSHDHVCPDGVRKAVQNALNPLPAPDDGPSVADCAADDRRWDVEKAGEQP